MQVLMLGVGWLLYTSEGETGRDCGRSWLSVQFSHSVVSDSLGPHGLQHTWFPCPSPTAHVLTREIPKAVLGSLP